MYKAMRRAFFLFMHSLRIDMQKHDNWISHILQPYDMLFTHMQEMDIREKE